MTDVELICEYMLNKLDAMRNEVIDCKNFMRRYEPDSMDYVEIMLSTEKLRTAQELFNDIFKIVRHFESETQIEQNKMPIVLNTLIE